MAPQLGAPMLGQIRFTGVPCLLHSAPALPRAHRMLPQRIECKESRIGRAPIAIPAGVNVANEGLTFTVKVRTCEKISSLVADLSWLCLPDLAVTSRLGQTWL